MLDRIEMVKRKMDESLSELCALSWMFSKQPDKNFSDVFLNLSLVTRQTKEAKELFKNKNMFRFVPATSPFDYLPRKNRNHDPLQFYKLPFRIVRFKITEDTYETVVTKWDADVFPPAELKKLYALHRNSSKTR